LDKALKTRGTKCSNVATRLLFVPPTKISGYAPDHTPRNILSTSVKSNHLLLVTSLKSQYKHRTAFKVNKRVS